MADIIALAQLATNLETRAGASTSANQNALGYWRRIALAAEAMAGRAGPANDNIAGYMERAADALERATGVITADVHNRNSDLRRIVTAMGAHAPATGSLLYRAVQGSMTFVKTRGPEILANPGPDFTNLTEWGPASASSTLALENGSIVATRTGSGSSWIFVDIGIPLTAGKTYRAMMEVTAEPGPTPSMSLIVWDNTPNALRANDPETPTGSRQTLSVDFVATNTGNHSLAIARNAADPNGNKTTLHWASIREVLP